MIMKKFLHSCILLEINGLKLLIDPGLFSFIEKLISPEDIGPVDIILISHQHVDHMDPQAIKSILKLRDAKIFAHKEVVDILHKEGITANEILAGQTLKHGEFTIKAIEAMHEPIPGSCPANLAFLINDKIFHPGDSYQTKIQCEILLLPIAGPWARTVDAIEFAKHVNPRMAIPIHDGIIKEFMLDRMYAMFTQQLSSVGIEFKPLLLGEKLKL